MPVVTGPLTTTSPSDTYPTHDSTVGLGGLRTIATTILRNAIPNARRTQGMLVFTVADSKYWQLLASPWNGVDADWQVATLGVGTTVTGITMFDSGGNGWALGVTTNGNLTTTTTGTTGYPSSYQVTYS